jgi:hypothetical protein
MVSWRARTLALAIRLLMRRARWGDPERLVRRARRLFGIPNPLAWARSRGVRIQRLPDRPVRGEWVTPPGPTAGVVLYLHGGGYVACSPATHRPITAALARLARRRVLAPGLPPRSRSPLSRGARRCRGRLSLAARAGDRAGDAGDRRGLGGRRVGARHTAARACGAAGGSCLRGVLVAVDRPGRHRRLPSDQQRALRDAPPREHRRLRSHLPRRRVA